jgi:hypothetical protein
MPESVEKEFNELDYVELSETLNEITYSITPNGETYPSFEHLSDEAERYFDDLSVEPRIALIRWIAERLASLAKGTKRNA